MSIVLIGINHKSAPVEVRERFAFSDAACAEGLRTLVDGDIVREGLIVSTCNRVEVLAETTRERLSDTLERVNQFLSRRESLPPSRLGAMCLGRSENAHLPGAHLSASRSTYR